jgi:RNA polymerase sigma-70 factor (ECF subfamily)
VRPADADLVARCTRGDASAFEELYRQHAARLYNLAYRMLGNAADAEDLLQEIFLQAHRQLGSFKGQSALGTWLYRLATNQCLDHLRSRAVRTAQLTASLDEETPHGRRFEPAAPTGPSITSLDLERAIAQLPDGCRAAFVLHDVEGLEHQEVADVLGIAEGTSKSQVHKARRRLRQALGQTARPAIGPVEPRMIRQGSST